MATTSALTITTHDHGTTRLVTLAGELDIASAGPVWTAVDEALGAGAETVVLDLAALGFTDSSGVHLVLRATRAARIRGARFVVLPGPPHVQAVFELAGAAPEVPFARSAGRFAR